MKSTITLITFLVAATLCVGCGKETEEKNNGIAESYVTPAEEPAASESDTDNTVAWNDKLEINSEEFDFTHDYSEEIKTDVDYMVSTSASLQEELENMDKIIEKYTPLAEAAQTQADMNITSGWFYTIWDTELNSLWSRFSDKADAETKEKILTDQRNWISLKEKVLLLSLGTREENGSMYPLLCNSFMEDITKNRAYVIAAELAKLNGENFVLPEKSSPYGVFVDNEGTGDVYSSLITRQSWNYENLDKNEALISIYRQGEITGSFTANGNGEYSFTSDDESVKGIIQINGWDGASFRITEASDSSPFTAGEEFLFPCAF